MAPEVIAKAGADQKVKKTQLLTPSIPLLTILT
jgi:hypothetical protein